MEEILASIRRIIADDQSLPGRQPAEADDRGATGSVAANEVSEPTSDVERRSSPEDAMPSENVGEPDDETGTMSRGHGVIAPQFVSPEGPHFDPPFRSPAPEVAGLDSFEEHDGTVDASDAGPRPRLDEPAAPPHEPEDRGSRIFGRGAAAPSGRIFSTAVDSSVTTAFNALAASRLVANSEELMGVVREMIRPLLKAWVDEHLPEVIERLVSAEIERISRGGP